MPKNSSGAADATRAAERHVDYVRDLAPRFAWVCGNCKLSQGANIWPHCNACGYDGGRVAPAVDTRLPIFTEDDIAVLEELRYETRGQRAAMLAMRGPVDDIDARIAALKSLADRIAQFRASEAQRGPTSDSGEAEE